MISYCEIVFYLIDGKFPLKKAEVQKLKMVSQKVTKVFLLINKMDLVIEGNPFDSREDVESSLVNRIKSLTEDMNNIEIICISSIGDIDEKYKNYYNNLLELRKKLDNTHEELNKLIKNNYTMNILNKNSEFLYYNIIENYNIKEYDIPLKDTKEQVEFIINNRFKKHFENREYNALYDQISDIMQRGIKEDIDYLEFDRIFDEEGENQLNKNLNNYFEKDFNNKVKKINIEIIKVIQKTFKESVLQYIIKDLEDYFSSEISINIDSLYMSYSDETNIDSTISSGGGGFISAGVGMAIGSMLGPLGIIAGGLLGSLFSGESEDIRVKILKKYFELLEKKRSEHISKEYFGKYIERLKDDILSKLNDELDKKYIFKNNDNYNIEKGKEKEIYNNIVKIYNIK